MRFWTFVLLILLIPTLLFAEKGIASWYTSEEEGALTANGEVFNPEAFTAAHKSLTFGTVVRVYNLSNGLSVDVKINDRGPFVEGRIIDLTPTAAKALDMYEKGITEVELEILQVPTKVDSKYDRPGDTGWYKVQIGSFANTQNLYNLYVKFQELGFKPTVEVTPNSLLRLTLRWISQDELEESIKVLNSLGFSDILLRSEQNPFSE
ncbi:MAG: septal ring lytic transglycosylase RlpA family protein [Sphaerochaetaceae bacterium]